MPNFKKRSILPAIVLLLPLLAAAGCEDVQLTFGDPNSTALARPAFDPTGISQPISQPQQPSSYNHFQAVRFVDLPVELRKQNYKGGSCYHASFGNCLTQQGYHEAALDYWDAYAHGASTSTIARNAEAKGYRYAYTTSGERNFLEWCAATRRWAAITYKPNHAINFVGFRYVGGRREVVLLDNNHTKSYEYVPADDFFRRWKGYGGGAITVVYDPLPPEPTLYASR